MILLSMLFFTATIQQEPKKPVPYETRLRAEELFWKGLKYKQNTPEEKRRQVRDLQESLNTFEFPDFFQRSYIASLAGQAGDLDLAFTELENLYQRGWVCFGQISDFPTENPNILADPRWKPLEEKMRIARKKVEDQVQPNSFGLDRQVGENALQSLLKTTRSDTHRQLQKGFPYVQPKKRGEWMIQKTSFKNSKGVDKEVTYFVFVPKGYDAKTPNRTLFYSHQGWFYRPRPLPWDMLHHIRDNPFSSSQEAENWIQIYPLNYRDMDGSTPVGQRVTKQIIREVKLILNVDDDQFVVAGHSNGGSMAYRALAEETSTYAGFVAINGWPDPNIAMRNWANRKTLSLSGEDDDLFRNPDVINMHSWASKFVSNWKLVSVKKGSHSFDAWIDDYRQQIVGEVKRMKRNSFAKRKTVQGTLGTVARVDWCQIDTVDIERPRATWHQKLVTPLVSSNGDGAGGSPKGSHEQDQKAGLVEASYGSNIFNLKTSRVGKVTVLISPNMVSIKEPVSVIVNGRKLFSDRVTPDREFMKTEFQERVDRKQVWIRAITLDVPK